MQATIRKSVSFKGVGLHGGKPSTVTVRPAPPSSGIWICRVDVTDREQMIRARYDAVCDTRLCTVLGNADGVTVSTVEHLMAALAGLGVDNALIDVDGPELPIMDGSALPFAEAILEVGLAYDAAPRRVLRVLETVRVAHEGASAELAPADASLIEFAIDFEDAAIGRQAVAVAASPKRFMAALADCRTFTRLGDIKKLHALGLAKGGGLHNAIVVDGARVLNPEGLRRPDEFVRHKALDAVGDLALAGGPILGVYRGDRAGHGVTNKLLRALFATPGAWAWEPATARPAEAGASPRVDHALRIAAE